MFLPRLPKSKSAIMSFGIILVTFILTSETNCLPFPKPNPDIKSTIMDNIGKIPDIIKSAIPIPKNVAISIHLNNNEDSGIPVQSQRPILLGDGSARNFDFHHQELLKSQTNENNSIPNHHLLTMVLISVAVFLVCGFMVLTLYFCYRRRKPAVRNIYVSPKNTGMSTRCYNSNSRDQELLPLPNVQKLISRFNKK